MLRFCAVLRFAGALLLRRSASEIVVPVVDAQGRLLAVFDVDSERPAAFDQVDAQWLERILQDVFAA